VSDAAGPEEPCDECGFDFESLEPGDTPIAVRSFGRRYRAPLTRLLPGEDDSVLRARPEPATWSALEYAAHVRDVFGAYQERIELALAKDRPEFGSIDPDAMAAERRYNELDASDVVDGLASSAESLARVLDGVTPDGWARVGLRGHDERSVLFTARRAVHEGHHHLLDIGRGLRSVRGR
jgi:hypothetical protein